MTRFQVGCAAVCVMVSGLANADTTSTTANVTKKAVKPSWSGAYSNYMNGPALAGPAGGSVNHYVSLKRGVGKNWSVTAVGRADSQWSTGKEDVNTQGDHYLKVGMPSVYEGHGITVTPQLRYYVPASAESKENNVDLSVSPRVYVSGSKGKLDMTYILISKVTGYSVAEKTQKVGSHGHWLSVGYGFNDWLTFDMAAYPGWSYKRDGSKSFNDMPIYPGVSFDLGGKASMSTYMEIISMKAAKKSSSFGASVSVKMF